LKTKGRAFLEERRDDRFSLQSQLGSDAKKEGKNRVESSADSLLGRKKIE
jgi:hypothetical protein